MTAATTLPGLLADIAAASLVIGTSRRELVDFVSAPPAWEEAHMTAIAWVLDEPQQNVLLVRHRRHGWSCPGGHLDPGESPAATAARELAEETGIRGTSPAHPFVLSRSAGCARVASAVHWTFGYLFIVDRHVALTPEDGQPAGWFLLEASPSPRPDDVEQTLRHLRAVGDG